MPATSPNPTQHPSPYVSLYVSRKQAEAAQRLLAEAVKGKAPGNNARAFLLHLELALDRAA